VRPFRIAFLIALAVWIGYALYYVFSPLPPHSFASDLGYSIVGIGRIAALATSVGNVADIFGWETWNDFPSFLYAPGGQYALAVPLNVLFGDPVRTVKLEQAVALTLAFCGMASLYGAAFYRSRFRWFAAFIYAAMPLSSTLVQWDADFAWIVALAPWAPLAALALGRRFGAAALPAAGVVCGLATFAFSPEQGLTVGLPLLIVTLGLFRRERLALPPAAVAGAFVAWLLVPAFVVLPTRYGAHPMWWTPGALVEFGSDVSGLRSLYGQGPLELIAGIYREQLVSSNPLFNVSGSLPFALAAGASSLVLSAYAFALTGFRSSLRRWWPVAGVAAICVVLACGTRIPFLGSWLWNGFIVHVPLLNALRTPDRFIQIAALLVALAAAYGLQRGFEKGGVTRRLVIVAGCIAVVGYGAFVVREGILGFGDPGQLPDFASVNATVEQIGGRTAVYAFPLNGSPLDFAAYAPRTSTAEFAWNLMQRHVDADGGVALLRRAGVRSVVTSPNWTQPSIDGLPGDMAEPVARSPFAHVALAAPSGAKVFRVDGARATATAATPVCTLAGPAGFELAAGQPFLSAAALVHGVRAGCARTVLVDQDPLDVTIPARAAGTWVGAELFGSLGFPAPNKFEIDRMQLAAPWYRDSYGGDSLLAGNPLITTASGSSNQAPFTIVRPGPYSVYVRASGPAGFQVRLANGTIVNGTSESTRGFAWVELPLGQLPAGPQTLELTILRFVTFAQKVVIDEVAVAPSGAAIVPLPVDAAIVTSREFAPPGGIDARAPQFLFPRLSGSAWTADVPVQVDASTKVGFINGEPEVRTSNESTHVRFIWRGPSGNYIASAVAQLAGNGARNLVSSQGTSFEARFDAALAPKPSGGLLRLRNGAPIDVLLTTGGVGADALTQLAVLRLHDGPELPTEYDQQSETWQFDSSYSLAILAAMRTPEAAVLAGVVRARAGTIGEIPFAPAFAGGPVTVDIQFAGGNGRIALRCGNAVDSVDAGAGTFNPSSTELLVTRTSASPCSVRIEWRSDEFALKSIRIRASGPVLTGWSAPQYFASGTYRWDSLGSAAPALDVDGIRWNPGAPRTLAAGMHRLTFPRALAPLPALRFLRAGAWPLPVPDAGAIAERSSTQWAAHPVAPATFEIAELNDGNWFARGSGPAIAGYECDLVNTCFDVPGSQEVSIGRTLPAPLALGFAISIADIIIAGLVLLLGRRQVRPARNG
jgi:hypothetical protein